MLAAIEKITEESYRVVKIIEEKKRCRTGWSSLPALAKKSERPPLCAGDSLRYQSAGTARSLAQDLMAWMSSVRVTLRGWVF